MKLLIRVVVHILALAGLAALLTLASGCARHCPAAQKPAESVPVSVSVSEPVLTVHPERRTLVRTIEQPGQIEGFEQTPIHARIGGHVQKLYADIGDRVCEGQLLAELAVPEMVEEHAQKMAAVAQAKAEVMQTQHMVTAAEAHLKKAEAAVRMVEAARQRAEATLVRWKGQYERDSRLVASRVIDRQSYEQTTAQYRAAESVKAEAIASVQSAEAEQAENAARVEKARADIAMAQARVGLAEADERRLSALLGYARITAPFDGVITKRSVDTGHLVQPSGGASTGLPLFVVVRTDPVRIFVDVPEADAPLIREGMATRVIVPALQEREFEGTVTRTTWGLETRARTLRAQIDLPNDGGLLRPGMYATVRLAAERPDALTVPASAIINRDDQSFVVCVENGVARVRPVKLGQRQGQIAEVLKKQTQPPRSDGRRMWESFSGTEEIVQRNPGALTDGQVVRAGTLARAAE